MNQWSLHLFSGPAAVDSAVVPLCQSLSCGLCPRRYGTTTIWGINKWGECVSGPDSYAPPASAAIPAPSPGPAPGFCFCCCS